MDALEFLKEQKRMCREYKTCSACPLVNSHCIVNHLTSDDDNKKIVNFVEQWSKEHPRKPVGFLRKSDFDGYKPTMKK